MAVLVQAMVDPAAAGVAFTAHPVTGDRDQVVLTAVPGLGDPLVSGEAVGEEWTITPREAQMSRPMPVGGKVLAARQAQAVADLARKVADQDPAAADRAVLSDLDRRWRENQLPAYRRLVTDAQSEATTATPDRLAQLVDQLGREAGIYLWYLAIVGGSAWKMEACLTRFCRQHLAQVLPEEQGGWQVLLRGLPGTQPVTTAHAVQSADWYRPVAAEISRMDIALVDGGHRHARLAQQRATAEQVCRAALAGKPRLLTQFEQLLQVNQRYAVIREEQARDFTLAWPVLRTCARRLGEHLVATGPIEQADDVFFCTRNEVATRVAGKADAIVEIVRERRHLWQRQRSLAAPLTLGRPARLTGDVIDRAVQEARGEREISEGVIVGQPASAGRATGPVRIVRSPQDFSGFRAGDVLVAKATAPCMDATVRPSGRRCHRRRHPRRARLPRRTRIRHPRRRRHRRRHRAPAFRPAGDR
jgi:rifampicin phosphotransferase